MELIKVVLNQFSVALGQRLHPGEGRLFKSKAEIRRQVLDDIGLAHGEVEFGRGEVNLILLKLQEAKEMQDLHELNICFVAV